MSSHRPAFRFVAIAAIVILILLSLAPIFTVFAPQPTTPPAMTPPIGEPVAPPTIDVGQ